MSYDYPVLNFLTAARYAPFAPAHLRQALCEPSETRRTVAIGASSSDEPVGLAVARHQDDPRAEILSVYVVPQYRRRRIGTELMARLERRLAARGATHAHASYACGQPGTTIRERFLQGCGWPLGGQRMYLFLVDLEVMSSPWATGLELPADCDIAPWHSISADEKDRLRRALARDPWVPYSLMPFRFEADLEPRTSLVLRRHGVIGGWLLTYVVSPMVLNYTNLFVRPEWNRSGSSYLSLVLLAEGFRRHEALQGRSAQGRFLIMEENARFVRFVDRRMKPFIRTRTELRRLEKALASRT